MFKLKFFKRKKKPKLVKLVDVSTRNLSEWDIMLYITYLWEKYDMYHIGFIFVGANEKHSDRWVLYSYSNRKKIFAPCRNERNETISWFQANRAYLQSRFGDISKAELIERVINIQSNINMDLNHIKYMLTCTFTDPVTKDENRCYITKTKSGMPIVTESFEDMAEGDLLFENEFLAKRYVQRHEKTLRALYKEDVINTIRAEAVAEADVIACRQSLKNRKVEDVI